LEEKYAIWTLYYQKHISGVWYMTGSGYNKFNAFSPCFAKQFKIPSGASDKLTDYCIRTQKYRPHILLWPHLNQISQPKEIYSIITSLAEISVTDISNLILGS
jgi:hypothetical protein